jgi:hypothetical protein
MFSTSWSKGSPNYSLTLPHKPLVWIQPVHLQRDWDQASQVSSTVMRFLAYMSNEGKGM